MDDQKSNKMHRSIGETFRVGRRRGGRKIPKFERVRVGDGESSTELKYTNRTEIWNEQNLLSFCISNERPLFVRRNVSAGRRRWVVENPQIWKCSSWRRKIPNEKNTDRTEIPNEQNLRWFRISNEKPVLVRRNVPSGSQTRVVENPQLNSYSDASSGREEIK